MVMKSCKRKQKFGLSRIKQGARNSNYGGGGGGGGGVGWVHAIEILLSFLVWRIHHLLMILLFDCQTIVLS